VGADFRVAIDVFALTNVIRRSLGEWEANKLGLLINNADVDRRSRDLDAVRPERGEAVGLRRK